MAEQRATNITWHEGTITREERWKALRESTFDFRDDGEKERDLYLPRPPRQPTRPTA